MTANSSANESTNEKVTPPVVEAPPEAEALLKKLIQEVASRVLEINIERALEMYGSAEAIAERMMESLPTVFISEPPVGPCYTTVGLARWRGVTRQAIHRQHRAGKLFAVKHGNVLLFPSCQFDVRGRFLNTFETLLVIEHLVDAEPLAVAIWLQTVDPESGTSPAAILQSTPEALTESEQRLDEFVPAFVRPESPAGDVGTPAPPLDHTAAQEDRN